jgi:hypothetical protein
MRSNLPFERPLGGVTPRLVWKAVLHPCPDAQGLLDDVTIREAQFTTDWHY